MSRYRMPRFIRLMLIASFTLFACGLVTGDGEEPSPAPPTDVPAVPTDTAVPTLPPDPTPETPPTESVSSPTATREDLEIESVHGYLDSFESWNVVGLIRNNTDRMIDNIEIEVELFDAAGNSLFVDTDYADLYNVAPGEVTPFSFIVYEEVPDADNFIATIVGNSTTDIERAQLDVLNTLLTFDESGDAHVTGELMNNNDRPIVINSLAAATYDGDGNIQTAESYSVSIRYLDPGEVGPFRVSITGPDDGNEDIESFEVFLDAQFDEPIEPYDLFIGDAIYYLDTFDNLHLVGEITNNSDVPLNVSLVAGIYDEEGVVLDASSLSIPLTTLSPGETTPYDFNFWNPINYTPGLADQAALYTIQVDAYWTWETSTETVDLSSQNESFEWDEFGGQFTGQVVNDSGGPVSDATIIAYLRDPVTDQVVMVGYDYVFEELEDGATEDYTVYLDIPSDIDVDAMETYVIVKGARP